MRSLVIVWLLVMVALGASAAPDPAVRCAVACQSAPGEMLAPSWERRYRAGCVDASGRLAGGSEVLHLERQVPALPKNFIPRGSPARTAARGSLDHDAAAQLELRASPVSASAPVAAEYP